MMRTTLTSYLDDFLTRGNATAFAQKHDLRVKRWSYRQIAETANRFARELEARSIPKGARVLLQARNSPEWVSAFFGCLLRGVIVVPLDPQSEPGFVKQVRTQVEVKLALCDSATAALAGGNLPVMELDELPSQISHHSSEPYPAAGNDCDDTVEIVFTSGTTAAPKGVLVTQRNLLANLAPLEQEIKRYLKWEPIVHPIRFLNLLPLSHLFGQFMGIFVPQLLSGEVFFQDSLSPLQILETTKRERISVVVTVPRILDALRDRIKSDYEGRGDGDKLRSALEGSANQHFLRRWWTFRAIHNAFGWKFWAFVSGGATLNPDTEEFWQRLGYAVIQGYGMTETASLISVNHPFRVGRGSIGKVLPGQEIKLADDGEILVRGANVSPGYWNEKSPPGASENGWFRTGDVGEMDGARTLYFKGRKKEVIVSSAGLNIYPADIELALSRQPELRAAVVIEIEGPHGPEPLAVLILRSDQTKPQPIIDLANKSLASHQQIRRWFVWPGEDFPRNTMQKIQRELVRNIVKVELAKSAELSGNGGAFESGRSNKLVEIITRISKEVPATLDPAAKLGTDLKLDSLARVELLSALEDRYQIEFDEAVFTEATTLAEVERMIREGRHEEAAVYPYPEWQQRWPLSWLRIALLYLIVLPVTRVLGRPKISGRENLLSVGAPLVFVCNHVTMTDQALVLFALPRKLRNRIAIAMDGERLREWLHPPTGTGWFTRILYLSEYLLVVFFFNVFSMPQKSGFRRSFVFAGEMMDHGSSLLVFPEGQRTKHGAMNSFMPGAGLLIQKLGAPVIPMRIDGLWELKKAARHFARRGEISVTIGKPLTYSAREDPAAVTADLEKRVRGI